MKINISICEFAVIIFLSSALFSCSNVRISTVPDSNIINAPTKRCNSLIIRGTPTNDNIGYGYNYVDMLVANLRIYRMFKEIYYPAWPDEKSDIELDLTIESERDNHPGENFAKGALIGASIMLLEPFIDEELDFKLTAYGNITNNVGVTGKINASCKTYLLMKTADGLGNRKSTELLAINSCMESLGKQIMLQLENFCP